MRIQIMTEPTEAECFEAEQELLFDVHFRQLECKNCNGIGIINLYEITGENVSTDCHLRAGLIAQVKEFEEGRSLWIEYERVNGYAFRPNKEGLRKLSRLLDLKVSYIEKRIYQFLENGISAST